MAQRIPSTDVLNLKFDKDCQGFWQNGDTDRLSSDGYI